MSSLALSYTVRAQAPVPVSYTEQVAAEGAGRSALYTRALSWAENKFVYAPTTALVADPTKSTIRVTGTGTLKPVDARGQDQRLTVLFTFRFQATDNGYSYQIGSFEVVPDPASPSQKVPLEEYQAELRTSRSNAKTFNDRRVGAQATSLASEAAMSFRSFMNSQPTNDHVGVADEQVGAQ
ncbi:DUF4468 domain-containing protein [Hymenobacter sp. ISL-91]|uniref:DUF4468 domain-containing protein n=1 Tax=Hymenobacter sp. ISL-91 TaxID=2819151 RepID=UPI001BE617D8|nr:DUF4468 domain-containing protein [Hymenobacter sp. ISL-91]